MLRHYIEFDEAYFDQRLHRIEIYDQDMTSGSATELIPQLPPVKLFYESDEDELISPMRGSRMEIYLHVDDPDQYDYFFTANKKRFEVVYYIDSEVKWHGFVEPELLELPYTSPSVLTLSCTCGLAYLKNIVYDPIGTEMVSFLDVISNCFDPLITRDAWDTLILYDGQYIFPTNLSQTYPTSAIENMYVLEENFYRNDEWMTCYDILKAIAERFDCHFKQGRYGFMYLQNNALTSSIYLRNFDMRSGTMLAYGFSNYVESFDNTNIFWLDGSQYKTIEAGWESLTINQTFDVRENIFGDDFTGLGSAAGINKDVSTNDGILDVDINEIDPGSETYQEILLYSQMIVDDYTYNSLQYLYIKIYLKEVNDCWMHVTIYIQSATSTYYLTGSGGWQTSSTQCILSEDDIGYYEIETEPPPINGDIYIVFGAVWPINDYADSYYHVDIYNSVFKVMITESEFETETEFIRATNSGYSEQKEIDTFIGDIPSVANNQLIYATGIYYLSSGVYTPVSGWTIFQDGDNATLNELVADEKASNYATNLLMLKGTVRHKELESFTILTISSQYFQIMSCEIDPLNNEAYIIILSYN